MWSSNILYVVVFKYFLPAHNVFKWTKYCSKARYTLHTVAVIVEERRAHWSPVKHKPQWEQRPELQHREVEPKVKYEKYEHPKEQRPKYINKPRMEPRPVERRIPEPKLKFEHPSEPSLRPKIRPKQIEVRSKMTTPIKPRVKPEVKMSPRVKEHEDTSAKNAESSKQTLVQGPASDENTNELQSPGGYYELSPLISRMLDTELQDIMIKIWQELPDNPTSEAEKLVVNKLRNKAGDDLRNVFGLNVSQRMLNVFNIMYIKMKFTSNPEGQELTKFLMRNNITKFRWNNVKPLTYNAIVKTVKDFDRLCATQVFAIGKVKVTITPLYQFTKCPLKLRTSYHIDNATSKNVINDVGTDKINANSEVSAAIATPSKANEVKSVEVKLEEKVIVKPEPTVKEPIKAETGPKEVPTVTKAQSTKPVRVVKVKKPAINKAAKKPVLKKEVKKEIRKEIKKPIDKKAKNTCKNILQAGNDFDELNDDEIMALVSQGIILDQCSGSDED